MFPLKTFLSASTAEEPALHNLPQKLPQRRWSHRTPLGSPLRIAYAGWPETYDFSRADSELWFFSYLVEQAVGRPVIPSDYSLPLERQFEGADVIICNGFGKSRGELEATVARHKGHALTLWNIIENTEKNYFSPYFDQMVGHVHASFGVRADISNSTYLHYGGWMGWSLRRETGCTWPNDWLEATPQSLSNSSSWASRPSFTAIVTNHGTYPRAEICAALEGLGLGQVDGGGPFKGNKHLPPPPKNTSGSEQKIAFLREYKFNVCPENSISLDGGYVTEKLPEALLSGAIPIYWGDPVPPPINPSRVLRFDGDMDSLAQRVIRLVQNKSTQESWFREPLLTRNAQEWLDNWCLTAQDILAHGWAQVKH